MPFFPVLPLLILLTPSPVAPPEPPGIRVSGTVPAFRSEPFPPDWVRLDTHPLADPDCRHYLYEVYFGGDHWLVRYVMLPEPREEFRDIEQVFLVPLERTRGSVQRVAAGDFQVEPTALRWKGRLLPLVDRRDLLRD